MSLTEKEEMNREENLWDRWRDMGIIQEESMILAVSKRRRGKGERTESILLQSN